MTLIEELRHEASRKTGYACLFRDAADEIERLRAIVNDHGVMQLEKTELLLKQKDEIERLRKGAATLCIGRPIIGILARDGVWKSLDGQCVVAADDLHRNDPYEEIERLRAELARLRKSDEAREPRA